ncbi:MAG: DUF6054 family protein [Alicyclobacillus sp.]|nr:DUF6054 family protein [Alicyclobacillus sp.]
MGDKKLELHVDTSPEQALSMVRNDEDADLVHEEFHDLGDGRGFGTLVFEKYFFRTKNRAALVVTCENVHGPTVVRAVATGSSEGLIFNFDWGAAGDFVATVAEILQDVVIPSK